MFDTYSLKARFYPLLIFFLPIIILGAFYSFEFQSVIHIVTSLGLVGALMYLFSQLGRDRGKKKETELWNSWGGAPSTQLLRLDNNLIDSITKNRYHTKLNEACPVPVLPTLEQERNSPTHADEVYKAWTKYLITLTRDTKKYSLLFKDNTSYGFRRNMWGLKIPALLLISILLVGNYLYWAYQYKSFDLLLFPLNFTYSGSALLLSLIFWIVVVNKSWVRIPAYSYAERLLESIDQI